MEVTLQYRGIHNYSYHNDAYWLSDEWVWGWVNQLCGTLWKPEVVWWLWLCGQSAFLDWLCLTTYLYNLIINIPTIHNELNILQLAPTQFPVDCIPYILLSADLMQLCGNTWAGQLGDLASAASIVVRASVINVSVHTCVCTAAFLAYTQMSWRYPWNISH